MHKIKYLFYISSCFILLGCSNANKEKTINKGSIIFPWKYSQKQISSLFDSIEYIPLEAHLDGLFKKASKLIVHDNKYFIFDYHGLNQVNVFDMNGKFLHIIGKKGAGPGEYVGMRNFNIKGDYVYLIDDMKRKLLIYDLRDGTFVEDKSLPFSAHDIAIADNGDYLFAQQRIEGERLPEHQQYNIFITSPDIEIKHNLFPFHDGDCGILSQLSYFSEDDNSIIFRTMVSDSIIFFDKNSPTDIYSSYYIDFGSKTVPAKYQNDDEALEEYNFLYCTPFISRKYMTGNYWVGKGYGYDPYIYEFDEKVAYVNNDEVSSYFFYPLFCDNDTIYSIYDQSYFNLWEKANKTPDLPENILEHLRDGDDVLIKYVLK